MKKIYIILLLVSTIQLYSQYVPEWVQVYSQNNISISSPNLCTKDNDGNIFISNSFYNGTDFDVMTTKYSPEGALLWNRQFGLSGNENIDMAAKLILDNMGNIIILGNASSYNYYDNKIFIIKYNSNGTLLNSFEFKSAASPVTFAIDIAADTAGSIYLCGSLNNYQTFEDSSLFMKLSSSLNSIWIKTSRDTNAEGNFSRSVNIEPAGNIYVTGQSGSNLTIKKYDNSGNLIWNKKNYLQGLEFSSYQYPATYLDMNQNLYISAIKRDINSNDTTKTVILKYNSSGVQQWVNIFNFSNYGMEKVQNIFSIGSDIFLHLSDYVEKYLIKINQNGTQQWLKIINYNTNYVNSNNSGKVITIGSKSAYGRNELFLERFNTDGNSETSYTFSYNGTGNDRGILFFITNDSKLLLAGSHDYSVMLVKLTPSLTQSYTISRNNLSKPILDSMFTYDSVFIPPTDLPAYSQVKNVYINIDTILHTAVGDLVLTLVHEGKTDTLLYQRGGPLDNMIGTKFSDTSVSSICGSGAPPYTGYFRPCYPLSQLNNLSASGPWILKIFDRRVPDTGVLKAWTLKIVYEIPIGIQIISNEAPLSYHLQQNYPNPFNPVTRIRFSILKQSSVKLTVYDILGKEIDVLADAFLQSGTYETEFDASSLPSGVYFYSLSTTDFTETKKMVLIK